MPLAIQADHALRSLSELRGLIYAVRDAPSEEMELDWVEWKCGDKLRARSSWVEIARHVIGFANRQPENAARIADGCAYLLIGAEPGCVTGVDAIDVAQLDQGVEPYTGGAAGPRWTPTYVEIDGHRVLVVTVEAPRWGDPIHTLRKAYSDSDKEAKRSYAAGTVFVRKKGRTIHPPDPASMDMLQKRLLRRGVRIDIDLSWTRGNLPTTIAFELRPDTARRWLEGKRRRLLAPVEAEEKRRAVNEHMRQLGLGRFGAYAASRSNVNDMFAGDRRTPESYREEVDRYLASEEAQLHGRTHALAVERLVPRLDVTVTNATDRNFEAVKVEIMFVGQVTGYVDDREVWRDVDFPTAPNLYGTQNALSHMIINYAGLKPPNAPRPYKGWADNEPGRARIHFKPVDLRPGYSVRLPSFRILAAPEAAGTTVTGHWHATSTNAEGIRQGQLALSVDVAVVSAETVLEDEDDNLSS